jgi:hypothetical protein
VGPQSNPPRTPCRRTDLWLRRLSSRRLRGLDSLLGPDILHRGARMSQKGPARETREPQSAEEPTPPFGHRMGFWRGTALPSRCGGRRRSDHGRHPVGASGNLYILRCRTSAGACGRRPAPTASTGGTPVEAVARQLQHFSCWWGRPCVAHPGVQPAAASRSTFQDETQRKQRTLP